jgi:hypothetical protein
MRGANLASGGVNQLVRSGQATVSSKRRDDDVINLDIVVFAIVTTLTIVLPILYISHS